MEVIIAFPNFGNGPKNNKGSPSQYNNLSELQISELKCFAIIRAGYINTGYLPSNEDMLIPCPYFFKGS
jgi:hypothetical protein